jgi:GDSL-like Lipase/Acylhydrolase family
MTVIKCKQQIAPSTLNNPSMPWRKMIRCDTPSGDFELINRYVSDHHPEKLIFAEGDSWFDKFTPIPNPRTNLIEEIRLPFHTVVVDVSTIGDESADMVKGWQAWRTRALFKFAMHGFDAIILSAGGNDLKNLYATKLTEYSAGGITADEIVELSRPSTYTEYFESVIRNIRAFIAMRDNADNIKTREAPIILHGYDYIQPRPAKAGIFGGDNFGSGPWLYPVLHLAGFSDDQMRSAADAVVDKLNSMLIAQVATMRNVFVIDSRGLLDTARAGTTSNDNDFLDEIHPNGAGFEKLARCCWNKALAELLGWKPIDGQLIPACSRPGTSTALAELPTPVLA